MDDAGLPRRELGRSGLTVSAIGLGCLNLSGFYGDGVEAPDAIGTVRAALDLGITLFDTSDLYGSSGSNEVLLGRALKGVTEHCAVATKFGVVTDDDEIAGWNGRPEYVKSACEASLRRLGVEVIDLYQLHRVDPDTPIEETVGAMADLVEAGKVRYLGLSEASPDDIRRAAAVAPIASLQSEYSMFIRGVETEVLPVCEDLGIGFLAYAPLGRGLLAGSLPPDVQLDEKDPRRTLYPWLTAGHLSRNVELAKRVAAIGSANGGTSAQVALAWLLQRPQSVIPIPGTRRADHLRENVGSAGLRLTADDLGQIDALVPAGQQADGERVVAELVPTTTGPDGGAAEGG